MLSAGVPTMKHGAFIMAGQRLLFGNSNPNCGVLAAMNDSDLSKRGNSSTKPARESRTRFSATAIVHYLTVTEGVQVILPNSLFAQFQKCVSLC